MQLFQTILIWTTHSIQILGTILKTSRETAARVTATPQASRHSAKKPVKTLTILKIKQNAAPVFGDFLYRNFGSALGPRDKFWKFRFFNRKCPKLMHALVQLPPTPPFHQAGVAGRLFVLLTRVPPMWNFGEAKIFVFFHQAGPKFPKNQPFLRVYLIRPVRNRWNQQRGGRPLPVLDILEHAWSKLHLQPT